MSFFVYASSKKDDLYTVSGQYSMCNNIACKSLVILECGPMPNVMVVALLNIGGALCSTPQSLADAHYLTAVQ